MIFFLLFFLYIFSRFSFPVPEWREVQGWLVALRGLWNFSVVEILERKTGAKCEGREKSDGGKT